MKDVLVAILKIISFVLFLPCVLASVIIFYHQIRALPVVQETILFSGVAGYLLLYLFIYDFEPVYAWGKLGVEKAIRFLKFAGYFLPVYTFFAGIVYFFLGIGSHGHGAQMYVLFAIAFTFAMHVILTAREIYDKDKSVLKAHYCFMFSVILIANILVLSLLLTLILPQWNELGFIKSLSGQTILAYARVYKALLCVNI